MIISDDAYKAITEFFAIPIPEKGGIIGGTKTIITEFMPDKCKRIRGKNIYIPNIKYLNTIIRKWNRKGICFMGMVHSHPHGQRSLSADDKEYIKEIVESLPVGETLFFPIDFGGNDIKAYKAFRKNGNINIREEKILILEKKESEIHEKDR